MRELIERLDTMVEAGDLSDGEKMAIAIIWGYKTPLRKKLFKEKELGDYGPDNSHVTSLAAKGLVKVKGSAISATRKAKAMKHVRVESEE